MDREMNEGGMFGLLGGKTGHSFSPEIHREISKAIGRAYGYTLFEKKPEEAEDFIKTGEWSGINVTVPYKKLAAGLCSELSCEAREAGAVNTVVKTEGGRKLAGHNTDIFGFSYMLRTSGTDVRGKSCAVLGTGGAAEAVKYVLRTQGAGKIINVGRKGPVPYEERDKYADAQILINATPLGMYPDREEMPPVDLNGMSKLETVLDVIYNPMRTRLLLTAGLMGLKTAGGMDMLTAQAVRSAEIFTGIIPDDEEKLIKEITGKLIAGKTDTVLIGMPGSGKSLAGRMISEELGIEFIDTDSLIEAREKKSIPEIFASQGEAYFRRVEADVIRSITSRRADEAGRVIACGGGVIKDIENYYNLAGNGRIILIERDIEKLAKEGRPLSMAASLEQLYDERKDTYRLWSDETVRNDGTPDRLLDDLKKKIAQNR